MNDIEQVTDTEWWCYRCDYDFTDCEADDGSPPPCPRCERNDQVEADDES